ncbi:MAG: hypothetical protein IKM02_06935, partial [Clostridia bacterium]|nr:hypothetical protein [Clostridia bacterium]
DVLAFPEICFHTLDLTTSKPCAMASMQVTLGVIAAVFMRRTSRPYAMGGMFFLFPKYVFTIQT